jgi:hypothetical protein
LCFTARLMSAPNTGWFSVVLEPIRKITFASSTSSRLFVMAPEPRVAARPATVELCHNRAQWSMLLVPTTARAKRMSA